MARKVTIALPLMTPQVTAFHQADVSGSPLSTQSRLATPDRKGLQWAGWLVYVRKEPQGAGMATLIDRPVAARLGDERFFLGVAIVMTLVIIAGFSTQLAMGRSTFYSPPLVHAHAIMFMGWVTIYLLQNIFAASGRMAIHRRLGWVAAGWMVPMIILAFGVTLALVRRGQVPYFFRPLHFLLFDPVAVLTFAALTGSAILLRSKTEWHRRLHLCGMAMLM